MERWLFLSGAPTKLEILDGRRLHSPSKASSTSCWICERHITLTYMTVMDIHVFTYCSTTTCMPQAGKTILSHYCGIHNNHSLVLNAPARTGRQLHKYVLKCQATSIFTFTSTHVQKSVVWLHKKLLKKATLCSVDSLWQL